MNNKRKYSKRSLLLAQNIKNKIQDDLHKEGLEIVNDPETGLYKVSKINVNNKKLTYSKQAKELARKIAADTAEDLRRVGHKVEYNEKTRLYSVEYNEDAVKKEKVFKTKEETIIEKVLPGFIIFLGAIFGIFLLLPLLFMFQ